MEMSALLNLSSDLKLAQQELAEREQKVIVEIDTRKKAMMQTALVQQQHFEKIQEHHPRHFFFVVRALVIFQTYCSCFLSLYVFRFYNPCASSPVHGYCVIFLVLIAIQ